VAALHAAKIAFAITSGRPPRGMAMLIEAIDARRRRRGVSTAEFS